MQLDNCVVASYSSRGIVKVCSGSERSLARHFNKAIACTNDGETAVMQDPDQTMKNRLECECLQTWTVPAYVAANPGPREKRRAAAMFPHRPTSHGAVRTFCPLDDSAKEHQLTTSQFFKLRIFGDAEVGAAGTLVEYIPHKLLRPFSRPTTHTHSSLQYGGRRALKILPPPPQRLGQYVFAPHLPPCSSPPSACLLT
jgi:hypothetical protein